MYITENSARLAQKDKTTNSNGNLGGKKSRERFNCPNCNRPATLSPTQPQTAELFHCTNCNGLLAVMFADGKLQYCPTLSAGKMARRRRLSKQAVRQETARQERPGQERSARHQRTLDSLDRLDAQDARIQKDFLNKFLHKLPKGSAEQALLLKSYIGLSPRS
jgi:ribosomal protein L37AE/L43A